MHWIALAGMENAVVALGNCFRAAVRLRQIQTLRRTRDVRMPRLLSGHISLTTKENYVNA
jgi:hypothetical protein